MAQKNKVGTGETKSETWRNLARFRPKAQTVVREAEGRVQAQ